MKTSVSNHYDGAVIQVREGSVSNEVDIVLDTSNTRLTSVISRASVKTLDIKPGTGVVVLIQPSRVILVGDSTGVKFPSVNNLHGTVVSVRDGGVDAEVNLRLLGGEPLMSIVTQDALAELDIEAGRSLTALIDPTDVVIGVKL
jgi:molybdate transport system regulatory protein